MLNLATITNIPINITKWLALATGLTLMANSLYGFTIPRQGEIILPTTGRGTGIPTTNGFATGQHTDTDYNGEGAQPAEETFQGTINANDPNGFIRLKTSIESTNNPDYDRFKGGNIMALWNDQVVLGPGAEIPPSLTLRFTLTATVTGTSLDGTGDPRSSTQIIAQQPGFSGEFQSFVDDEFMNQGGDKVDLLSDDGSLLPASVVFGAGEDVLYEANNFNAGWESYSGPTSISGEAYSASYSATLAVDVPRYSLDLDGTAYYPFQLIVEAGHFLQFGGTAETDMGNSLALTGVNFPEGPPVDPSDYSFDSGITPIPEPAAAPLLCGVLAVAATRYGARRRQPTALRT